MSDPSRSIYEFDCFRLDPQERLLLHNGSPVPLTPKAFDTLVLLVQNSGHLLLKDELMKTLWPDSFVEEVNLSQNVSVLRKTLGEKPNQQRYIATVPGKGYRFVAAVSELRDQAATGTDGLVLVSSYSRSRVTIEEQQEDKPQTTTVATALPLPRLRRWSLAVAAAVVLVAGVLLYRALHQRPLRLRRFDPVAIADFRNNTGDAVFTDTLKQALIVDLEQSPYLKLLSDAKIAQVLRMMERPAEQPLTADAARELCQRAGGKAVVMGSIAQLGRQYVISLTAADCASGDPLADEQARADNKEGVLPALNKAARTLRARLGESLPSVQKYSTPVEQATTTSLQALRAYSAALRVQNSDGFPAAVPLYQRAIELDPNFAMAYARLGSAEASSGESRLAAENLGKAFRLADRTSEREKFYIASHYHLLVTGDVDKAIQVYREWLQTYPRDNVPLGNISTCYVMLGAYDRALPYAREALKTAPTDALSYLDLADVLLGLNRLDEAEVLLQQMRARNFEVEDRALMEYQIAFLKGDTARMQAAAVEALHISMSREIGLLPTQSDTEAYFGRLRNAREYSGRAIQAILRTGAKETAATWEADAALREAELGNRDLARRHAEAARAMATGRPVAPLVALALARAGVVGQAEQLAVELNREFRSDTLLNMYWLPSIRAAIALDRGQPEQALRELQATACCQLGGNSPGASGTMYPVYLRGLALLASGNGAAAEEEFQQLLNHSGIAVNSILVPLARLGLARSYAAQGDSNRARAAYGDLFRVWQQADDDLPVLRRATREAAKLK